jgi:hypothetical protein
LQTYDDGNGRWRAGDGGAVRLALGDGEDGLWCSSSSRDSFDNGVGDKWSSSKQQLSAGGLGLAGQWCELKWQWRLGLGSNSHEGWSYL